MTQFNPSNNKLEKMSVRSAKTKLSLPSHSRIHQKDSAEILERTIEVKQNQIDSTAGIFYSLAVFQGPDLHPCLAADRMALHHQAKSGIPRVRLSAGDGFEW
jgi:hypothetical protein